MSDITKEKLRQVQNGLRDAVKAVGEEAGVDIKFGRGSYGHTGKLTLEINNVGTDGRPATPESKAFSLYCDEAGLEAVDLWGTFRQGRQKFQLTGYNVKAPKYPFQARGLVDGKDYKFTADMLRRAVIEREAAPVAE